MNFRQLLSWLMFWQRGEADLKNDPFSIVLLVRKPYSFSEAELQSAAQRGWGRSFDGKNDSLWFVSVSNPLTVLKAGKYVVRLIQSDQPYSDDLEESARNLPREEQKKAWFEHRAWFSLELWNGKMGSSIGVSKKEAYAVLARFALQLGDSNCSAIYFPKEGWMLPNDGSAEAELNRLIKTFRFA
jgi:hypothetical protein